MQTTAILQANAAFSVKSWDEKTWDGKPHNEVTGAKLTRAEITYVYHGDLEGEGTVQYLMDYHEDGTGQYVGLERVVGSIGGRSGSFVLQHIGTFDAQSVKASLSVVPGSGTGELRGLHGTTEILISGHQESYPLTLAYGFDHESG